MEKNQSILGTKFGKKRGMELYEQRAKYFRIVKENSPKGEIFWYTMQ